MDINVEKLYANTSSQLKTELLFLIASYKAVGKELLLVSPEKKDQASKVKNDSISCILREQKRIGKIQLFVRSDKLSEQNTEREYLENKYPGISGTGIDGDFYIIKL